MLSRMQLLYTLNLKEIRTYAFNLSTHGYQKFAQLLKIRFTRSIIDCSFTFSKN